MPSIAGLLMVLGALAAGVPHSSSQEPLPADPAARAAALMAQGDTQEIASRYKESKASHEQALAIYRTLGDRAGEANASRHLGRDLFFLGDRPAARAALDRAAALFHELQDPKGLAVTYNNLVYVADAGPEKDAIREQALRYAREGGMRKAACGVIHEWGDELFAKENYAAARPKLQEALACYEDIKEDDGIGRALVSLGRLQRVHGQYVSALEYYTRALALQPPAPDGRPHEASIQTLNAIAVVYQLMARYDEARTYYERALAAAQALQSEPMIAFMMGQFGGYYHAIGQFDKAIPLLEGVLARTTRPAQLALRYRQLARAYSGAGDLTRAMEYADKAVATSKSIGPDLTTHALHARAEVSRARKDYAAAERDLREAVGLVEEVRAKVVPIDFMKRGYSELNQELFTSTIELLVQQGRASLALETAELARGRALLDLLATRNPDARATDRLMARTGQPPAAGSPASAASTSPASSTQSQPAAAAQERAGASAASASGLRGAETTTATPAAGSASAAAKAAGRGDASKSSTNRGGPALALDSPDIAASANTAAMVATARRLHSTLLAYWVGPNGTCAWVVSPRGEIHAARIELPESKLEALVAESTATMRGPATGFGLMNASQRRPWRELYAQLIQPVRAYLPTTPNSLLTIVPHGPLFRVSFAALQDERGRYLVEQYRLHYTPAIGVLQFTARHAVRDQQGRARGAREQALLVGDPGPLTPEPGGDSLAALPWARREVADIASHLPAGTSHVLIDDQATEAGVRAKLEGMDLLHFATHGVIQQQEALASYLALRPDASGTASSPSDGRLTAEEVYSLDLHARLVVLSACSTAIGPMTGDGVIGFTRAFLYAGAASVIVTEWDVPDEAGYELMRRFYRARRAHVGESDALRTAQLDVIQALRKGTLKVSTPGGDVTVPEHPLFWAGFVLVGEP